MIILGKNAAGYHKHTRQSQDHIIFIQLENFLFIYYHKGS